MRCRSRQADTPDCDMPGLSSYVVHTQSTRTHCSLPPSTAVHTQSSGSPLVVGSRSGWRQGAASRTVTGAAVSTWGRPRSAHNAHKTGGWWRSRRRGCSQRSRSGTHSNRTLDPRRRRARRCWGHAWQRRLWWPEHTHSTGTMLALGRGGRSGWRAGLPA